MKWILFSAVTLAIPLFSMLDEVCNEPAHCEEECEPDLFKKDAQVYTGYAEFLYWTMSEGGLDYALKMRHSAWSPTVPSFAQGRFETATYDFDPGFRVGFSFFRATHYWEVKWQYTRMTLRGYDESHKPAADTKYLTGTWPQIMPTPLTSAKSHLHLNYNVVDMLIDRVFIPNPHLRLKVIGGGVATWMSQDWKVHYFDVSNSTEIRNRWRFVGAGLKTGSVFDWYWTGDLYMSGSCTFGALIGSYRNRSKGSTNYQADPSVDTSVPFIDSGYHDIRPTFTAQFILGPSWQKNYPCNRVEVFAGFESNLWMNLQEIYRSTANSPFLAKETWVNSSMLALYGVTARVTVDF